MLSEQRVGADVRWSGWSIISHGCEDTRGLALNAGYLLAPRPFNTGMGDMRLPRAFRERMAILGAD